MATTKNIFFVLALLIIAMASSVASKNPKEEKEETHTLISQNDIPKSLRGLDYVTNPYKPREIATCDKFPRVCRTKGSTGPDCCSKQCVNVMTDNFNCGECGRKCRFREICCHGNCVDIMHDERNCGGCKNKCKKGSFCYYGMCSYA